MDDKRSGFPAMVGGSSLLVIFAVLCLTVFALLSVSTAQANRRLSEQTVQAVEEYYAADCRAEEILAEIRAGKTPEGVTLSGDIYSYTCPISETQALAVTVRAEGGNYEILRWQAVSTVDWAGDDSLPIWDGK